VQTFQKIDPLVMTSVKRDIYMNELCFRSQFYLKSRLFYFLVVSDFSTCQKTNKVFTKICPVLPL
jgi:hypothetical protein